MSSSPIPFGPIEVNKTEYWLTIEPNNSVCICDNEGEEIQDVALRLEIAHKAILNGIAADLTIKRMMLSIDGMK